MRGARPTEVLLVWTTTHATSPLRHPSCVSCRSAAREVHSKEHLFPGRLLVVLVLLCAARARF